MRSEDSNSFSIDAADYGDAPQQPSPAAAAPQAKKPAVLDEVLIEEVSIDGMCGVD
ncbi:MAG: mycofactocin precursor MftA [Rhodospirillales bacterium]